MMEKKMGRNKSEKYIKLSGNLWKYLSKQCALTNKKLSPTPDCKRIHSGVMRLFMKVMEA